VGLYPNVIFCGQITACIASIYGTCRFDKHGLALGFGEWLVFHAFWDYKHFPGPQVNLTITEFDTHLPIKNHEGLIRIGMTVPDKISLKLNQFEMIIVQLRDDFRRPMFGKLGKLFLKVDGRIAHIPLPNFSQLALEALIMYVCCPNAFSLDKSSSKSNRANKRGQEW
jgi:hypothetical protein